MTLNTIDDTSFPPHSDTHFLSKNVENLTPFQIKLSRNKEKQTDNIQMTLVLFYIIFFSTCPETKQNKKTGTQMPLSHHLSGNKVKQTDLLR